MSKNITEIDEKLAARVRDRIRGCLMAGAAGDALGYPVEFLSRNEILSRYGTNGITEFDLADVEKVSTGEVPTYVRKALISDDTQMTLFTADSILMGLTRGYTRGCGGRPEMYAKYGYLDWYHTQTRSNGGRHDTWLSRLPEMAHRRAPGGTCLNACASMDRNEEVHNNSKGCGGIMRVAPMGLLAASYESRGELNYTLDELAKAGAEIAMVTHLHPLGFLPAALLTVLIYKLVLLPTEEIMGNIDTIISDSLAILDEAYKGEYSHDREILRALTEKAVALAHSNTPDHIAISQLGQGWVAEETWAIAIYCAVRHIDSVAGAIIAAVNHDGDSDSTGSVCGNIMGAIHGYEAIKTKNIFCPSGHSLEDTLELSEIILALADDIATGCIISEYSSNSTPEMRQWYLRYCEHIPAGISGHPLPDWCKE